MEFSATVRRGLGGVLLIMELLAWPDAVGAQGAVGSGPLTGSLADTEPTSGVLGIGPIKLAPGIVVREIGWDSNVFDESEDPKDDYVASVQPDVAVFARSRFFQVSAFTGVDFTYYRKYESERSFGHAQRARVDILLSRLHPFVAGGQTIARTRPNGEIDTRANLKSTELSGGLALEMSAYSSIYVAVNESTTRFQDAFEEGVELGQALSRSGTAYSAGLRTELTPLTAVTLSASYTEDRFKNNPLRDAETYAANASLRFAAEAILTGVVDVSYQDFRPVDPQVKPYRGAAGSIAIAYPLLDVGRIGVIGRRAREYSFDEAEAYFIENSLSLTYTHRLFGQVDAQVGASRALFRYDGRDGVPARQDTLDSAAGSLGYNLRNRTRVSLNYEYARRQSPEFSERNYDRRRVFMSWAYVF